MEDCGNSRKFHGTFISGNRKSGRNASFDIMPADHKEVRVERRNILSVADHDKEEKEHDHVVEECDKIEGKESSTQLKSWREFTNFSDYTMSSANRLAMRFQDDKKIDK